MKKKKRQDTLSHLPSKYIIVATNSYVDKDKNHNLHSHLFTTQCFDISYMPFPSSFKGDCE